MSAGLLVQRLIDRIELLERVVGMQSVRINNLIREARVLEVDTSKGMAVVSAQDVETHQVPWMQHAGSIVDWEPPAVGQRMVLISPSGDIGRGFLIPGGYTDDVPPPDNQGEMSSRTIGDTKIETRSEEHKVTTPTFRIKGNLVVEGDLDITGEHVKHNGRRIDDQHVHGGVSPGAANTDVPTN